MQLQLGDLNQIFLETLGIILALFIISLYHLFWILNLEGIVQRADRQI